MQDDDDFENIKVEALYSYDLELIKTDEDNQTVSGAKFTITKKEATTTKPQLTNNGGLFVTKNGTEKTLCDNEQVDGNKTITVNNLEVNKDYFYEIQETEVATGYNDLLSTYKIIVPAYIDENLNLNIGVKNITAHPYYATHKFVIVDENYNIVDDTNDSDNLYGKISVEAVNDAGKRQIHVTIENQRLKGSYNLRIKKYDEQNKSINGIEFNYEQYINYSSNNTNSTPTSTGTVKTKTISGVLGRAFINVKPIEINQTGQDMYKITEVVDENNEYFELKESIYIYVNKIEADGVYKVESVSLSPDSVVTEKEYELINGETLPVKITSPDNNLYWWIVVKNKKITGDYNLELEKVDSTNQNTKLSGVTFNVLDNNGKSIGDSLTTGSNGMVTINRTIGEVGIDHYTINEINLGDNKYIPIADYEYIDIYVRKTIENNAFVAKDVSLEPFENDSDTGTTSKNIYLVNGDKAEVKVEVENGVVKVTIPNEKIEGEYDFVIRKSNGKGTYIQNITFKVTDEATSTSKNITTSRTIWTSNMGNKNNYRTKYRYIYY